MLGGLPGFRGRGLPWTHPRSVRTPHRLETLTSIPRRCAPHYPVQSPREGALQTSAPAPRSLLPTPLQPLLPGVTRRRAHVMGRGLGAGRAARYVRAPPAGCDCCCVLCLSPVRGLWAGWTDPSQLTWPGFSERRTCSAPRVRWTSRPYISS